MKKLVNYDYVDMSPDEIAQSEEDHKSIEKQIIKITAKNDKIKADKATGNQKLKDLGLTDDEISALIG